MKRRIISSAHAPQAIGSYSQAVASGDFVFVSGQIPLCPQRMQIVGTGIEAQARQTFDNLQAIASAADATLDDAVKINISMTDLQGFSVVNDVMAEYFSTPYPARACVQVAALPKGALIEIEAVLEKRGR